MRTGLTSLGYNTPNGLLRPITTEHSDFLNDSIALFKRQKSGHMGKWGYSDRIHTHDPVCGAELWKRFLKQSTAYYPCRNEISLINKYAGDIARSVHAAKTIFDFGPGSSEAVANKTLPLLSALRNVSCYIPVDISEEFAKGAAHCVSRLFPSLQVKPEVTDFFSESVFSKGKEPAIGLSFGTMISNIPGDEFHPVPVNEVVLQLSCFRKIIGEGGYLLITHDSNQDEQSILKSYQHPAHSEHEENLMFRIKRDLHVSGGFKPDAWRYEPVWHAERFLLSHNLVSMADQTFWIGPALFKIREGEHFTVDNSYKYPVELFRSLALKAGFSPLHTYLDDKGWMALHILRT